MLTAAGTLSIYNVFQLKRFLSYFDHEVEECMGFLCPPLSLQCVSPSYTLKRMMDEVSLKKNTMHCAASAGE